jgi:hypothetical protein
MGASLGRIVLLIEDEVVAARTVAKRTPVMSTHQRFGNTANCKTLRIAPPAVDNSTYAAYALVARVSAPPQVSRANLRVVQTKRGCKSGRIQATVSPKQSPRLHSDLHAMHASGAPF